MSERALQNSFGFSGVSFFDQLLGSRCGPFPEAINALARQAIDVRSLISNTFPIEEAVAAFEAAEDPENVKVLLKINPR